VSERARIARMETRSIYRIAIEDLPPRAVLLSTEQIRAIFGGCWVKHQNCASDSECCPEAPYCDGTADSGLFKYCFESRPYLGKK
jgi:hypothetical protein